MFLEGKGMGYGDRVWGYRTEVKGAGVNLE